MKQTHRPASLARHAIGVLAISFLPGFGTAVPPEVKVSGAMKNVMRQGDLSAHADLDTIDRTHLYALGPVAGLKGELLVLDGKLFSSSRNGTSLLNRQNDVSKASFLVYSHVKKWKAVTVQARIGNYAEMEKLVESSAVENGYDTGVPFAFRIEARPEKISYHVIDWEEGAAHTMENHKQFARSGEFSHANITMLGFYSRQHQGIFTHHGSYSHVHLLEEATNTVGHLDHLIVNGKVTIYFPEQGSIP